MRIKLTSIMVDDQAKALEFYTKVLGFVKKTDVPVGSGFRWITVVSPEAPDAIELVLEPTGFPFAQTYQKELFSAGIPATMLFADDVEQEYARLRQLGVVFTGEPVHNEYGVQATFDDTCGNLILLQQG